MARTVTHEFTVQGDGAFPLDMLRYDACYPHTGNAVSEMMASQEIVERGERRKQGKPFVVMLRSTVGAASVARWASFGWSVTLQRKC